MRRVLVNITSVSRVVLDMEPKLIRLVILNGNREKIYEHEHIFANEHSPNKDAAKEKYNGIFNDIGNALQEGKPFVEIEV
jgi:hypothetical protein